MTNLNEAKTNALNAYKAAKMAWMETVSKENINGDFDKWKMFCGAKTNCMKLGVRI